MIRRRRGRCAGTCQRAGVRRACETQVLEILCRLASGCASLGKFRKNRLTLRAG